MGRAALLGLLLLAGCDSLFNLEVVPDKDAPLPDVPLPLDLIAVYDFESLGSNTIPDITGNGHDGSCTSCPTSVPGPQGHGMGGQFSASTSTVLKIAPIEPLTFTIMMWLRVDAAATLMCPVNKPYAAANQNSYQLCVLTTTASTAEVTYITANDTELRVSVPMTVGMWHHFAVTYDGFMKALYYDGALQMTGVGVAVYDGRQTLIGGDYDNNGATPVAFVNGALDDVRFYNGALNAEEIGALENN